MMFTNLGTSEGNKELSAKRGESSSTRCKGTINKEIADKLNISLNTVLTPEKYYCKTWNKDSERTYILCHYAWNNFSRRYRFINNII